ncbi:sulfatase-like hydrolase/transferase [Prosthecobacter sp.]|uniref:sulfatase-like hydrolase/transferase n=1 Tax=Prosthecobacter sp. TaxID=1965333 RepID=UPI002ABA9F85|nr:sulfatase-like hydrolase/transferase [Prosthecobacter sp.]MDZ4401476.1 sulfatase-like hydrolase/transferase [Prosthecobacter sp.]
MKLLSILLSAFSFQLSAFAADRPNILWLTSEDHGPHMGCYGDTFATTPNVDALAAKGMLFKRVWSNAPVCAAARTTLIAGMYPPSTGGEHMRSMTQMPKGTKMYPQFLREAGYYCTNNSKEDYNLKKPEGVWDLSSGNAHWKNRKDGQPFFAIFNETCSHESQLRKRPHEAIHDPAKVRVPAYHPDTPEVRQDWAQYYDQVTLADASAGKRLAELEAAGLAADTIIFYYADHGSGMPRNKRWPCNSGLQVPMVVYFPPNWKHLAPKEYGAGLKSDRLVSFVDLAPTLLSIIGVQPPEWMQGHAFAGKFQTEPQPFVYGFRGRMDERIDTVRSVTDGRFVYLRNFMPHLSQAQHVSYQFETPSTRVWRKAFDDGKATPEQSIFWKEPKDAEELYDLQSDPDEVHNLAAKPEHAETLAKMRTAQENLALKIRDVGLLPEGEMHQRSEGTTPYDMGHDDKLYPLARILKAAGNASSMKPDAIADLKAGFADSDNAIRYWSAMGILMRGTTGVEAARQELAKAARDSSTHVQVAANWALAKHGNDYDRPAALTKLVNLANWSQHNVFTAMSALNAIDDLGDKAKPIAEQLKTLPAKGESPDGRFAGYVARLLAGLNGGKPAFEDAGEPPSKKKKGKGKK